MRNEPPSPEEIERLRDAINAQWSHAKRLRRKHTAGEPREGEKPQRWTPPIVKASDLPGLDA